jgi:hypothetical protein
MSFGRLYNHQESRFQRRYAMNNPIASLPVVAATQDNAHGQPSCMAHPIYNFLANLEMLINNA